MELEIEAVTTGPGQTINDLMAEQDRSDQVSKFLANRSDFDLENR